MADTVDKAVYVLSYQTGDSKAQLDAVKRSTDAVVQSTEKLAVSEEKVSSSTRATGDELGRLEARYNQRLRLEQRLQAEQSRMARLAQEGVGTEAERARVYSVVEAQIRRQISALDQMATHTDKARTSTGLARYELINLGRQVQDVGVSLAGGQSPLRVLIEQGTQIADVFVSSRATLGAFFSQAAAGAGRFATSALGITAALAGIAGGALAAASSWGSAQKDIQRALLGIGAASGVTVDDINKIAAAGSSITKMSTSEATEAASAFAATGRIYHDNILAATKVTYDFALAMGKNTTDAAKTLAAALADPVHGLSELEKQYGVVDGATKAYIRTLMQQNREQEAQALLLDTFGPKISKAAELTSVWAKAWNLVSNAASEAYTAIGKALSPASDQDKLASLQARLTGQLAQRDQPTNRANVNPGRIMAQQMGGGDDAAIKATQRAIDELTASIQKAAEAAADQRFNQFARAADDAVRATIPEIEQIQNLTDKLAALKRAQEDARVSGKMELAGQAGAAAAAIQLQLRMTVEAQQAEERRVTATTRLADAHKNVSVEVAKQVKGLEDQIKVAQARAGADTLAAQERATYNRLLLEGKTLEEASLIASKEKALAVAQANKAVDDQIVALRQSVQLERARMEGTEASAQAAIAYENAIRSGADATKAAALAAATLNANMEKAEIAAENFANAASQASNALDQAGRASGGIGTLGGTHSGGQGVGIILPGGRGLGAQSIGDPKFAAAWPIIMAQEQARTDAIKKIMDAMKLSLKERTPGTDEFKAAAEAQQRAAEALQQAAEDQKQAAAAAAEAARQAGDLRFQNIAAQYIINGIAPLAINAMIESGAIQRFDASSTFKTQLDLYRRAGVSSSQTRADILAGIIGEGVAPTELLQALDSLTDAVSSNTDAQIGLSDFYTQQGDRLLGYRGYNVQPAGFPKVNTGTGTGTTTGTTGTGAMPYGGVVNAGPAGTGLSTGGTLMRIPGTNQWVQTSSYNTYTGLPTSGFTPQPYPTVSGTSTSLYSKGFYQMAEGGVAYGPQYGVFGEAGPEAFVPLRGGSIPVQLMHKPGAAAAADAGPRTIINITAPLVNFMAEPTRDEVRASAYQAGQMMRRMMAA